MQKKEEEEEEEGEKAILCSDNLTSSCENYIFIFHLEVELNSALSHLNLAHGNMLVLFIK